MTAFEPGSTLNVCTKSLLVRLIQFVPFNAGAVSPVVAAGCDTPVDLSDSASLVKAVVLIKIENKHKIRNWFGRSFNWIPLSWLYWPYWRCWFGANCPGVY